MSGKVRGFYPETTSYTFMIIDDGERRNSVSYSGILSDGCLRKTVLVFANTIEELKEILPFIEKWAQKKHNEGQEYYDLSAIIAEVRGAVKV